MEDYSLPTYDRYRDWIREARNKNKSWEEIKFGNRHNEDELKVFLEEQQSLNFWEINYLDWYELVKLQKEAEEQTKEIDYLSGQAIIKGEGEDNTAVISTDPHSAWQLYKKKLKNNGFNDKVIGEIERATLKILKRLSNDTTTMLPIKGLVIGNVQSGKTANMAALMAMAADCGWNMFIVLSGTVENLRNQTQKRLFNDLNQFGNLNWAGLEHLAKNMPLGQRAQDLHFDRTNKQRYFTVCLKNPGRLRGLIQWLQVDQNKQRQMKILVIDDEADQAGINTANIDSATIRTINRLIRDLVNGRNEQSQKIDTKYQAMNYIGYTATPYANILNEAGEDSLYPRNFIATLSVSMEYFGPQQIFGIDGCETYFSGMNIINDITDKDLERIRDIHDGNIIEIPKPLQNAICWFACGVACLRLWGYKKPISMLIHTSQITDHHKNIAQAVKQWLSSENVDDIIIKCKEVWDSQTSRFTFEKFRESYPQYDRKDIDINKYPTFQNISDQLYTLFEHEVTNIPLDENGTLTYHAGIHMCVDNCKNNGVNEEGMFVRLAYPESDKMPQQAPAFIVIGGATLSRGLTLEGLISTFFLRSVSQADTLMQMGRWFGYRRGYELLPRLWLTEKTQRQFKFLAELDQELRDEIHEMDTLGKSPAHYGPRVKNSPKASFIKITAKNRMQQAKATDMNFSGAFNQTYLFDNDLDLLKNNIDATEKFITLLGRPEDRKSCNNHAAGNLVWRNIQFSLVANFLKQFRFNERLNVFNDIDSIINWIEKATKDGKLEKWNIVLAGNKYSTGSIWKLPFGKVNNVKRSKKKNKNESDTVINIGVLSDPQDIIADVDIDGQPKEVVDKILHFKSKYAKEIRSLAGLSAIPQLLIYRIDKNSQPSNKESDREPLGTVEDIIGLCINIPGGRRGGDYIETVSIHMKNDIFDDEGDLGETNAN